MIYFLVMIFSSLFGMTAFSSQPADKQNTAMKTLYDFTVNDIYGNPVNLSKYKGKKVLIVNVASECGYTPQYKDLEELHEKYGNKIAILGFPANNFGSQEPGTNKEIAQFCTKNYGVKFDMFEKISVKGNDQHPLYKFLSTKDENGWNNEAPSWNFCKYIINEKGELVKFFKSGTNPMSKDITDLLQ